MHIATYVKLEVLKCYKMILKSYYIANAVDDKHIIESTDRHKLPLLEYADFTLFGNKDGVLIKILMW
uniref:Uncharacterized protein n=1 Tax=Glossina morsitans morsitans TaxID=37546 RepID=A0A1B0GEL9_GLOMM